MKVKTRDIISSVGLILVGIVGFSLTSEIPEPFREYDLGAAFLPRLVLALIIGLSVLKIVVTLIENKPDRTEKKDTSQFIKGFGTIVLVGGYCFCFKPAGFLLDTLVYLFLQILLLTPKDKRKLWKIVLIDVIAVAVIYATFTYGFALRLPKGPLTFI